MQLVETVLGNSKDPVWKDRLAHADVDSIELSQWDAQKNRLRKDSRKGRTIAISLDRNASLHDGDVLFWDEATKEAVVCKIDLCEVLVIDLSGLAQLPPSEMIERSVQLGHALGNQHWPAVVQNGHLYAPMAVNRLVMSSVMNTHHFKDISFDFVPGSEIVDKLEPNQARRLFGGTEQPMHGGHSHAHLDAFAHDHHHDHDHHEHHHGHDHDEHDHDEHHHKHEHEHNHDHDHDHDHEGHHHHHHH